MKDHAGKYDTLFVLIQCLERQFEPGYMRKNMKRCLCSLQKISNGNSKGTNKS